MRRYAVMLAISLVFAGACKETLLLPPDTKPDGGTGGSGGTGSGGAPGGTGGRTSGSGGGSGGRPAGGTGGSGMPSPCAGGQKKMMLPFDIKRAQVLLAVGRNTSMMASFGNGNSRMSAVQQAIHSVVEENGGAINFAYEEFPSNITCSNGTACCASPNVSFPAPYNARSIDQTMSDYCLPNAPGCTSVSSGRPIADALRKVMMPSGGQDPILTVSDPQIERHVILLVDGGPQCSSEDPQTSCNNAKSQLSQLKSAGVRVHIVPISDDVEPPSDCLKAMATQSDSGATSNQPFGFRARDPGELMSSLSKIIDDAAQAACTIILFQVPNDPRNVSVEILGHTVPLTDFSGQPLWSLQQNNTIEVYGQPCRDVQNSDNTAVKVWQCQ